MNNNKKLLQNAIVQVRRPQNFLTEEGIQLYRKLMIFEQHLPPSKRTQVNQLLGIYQNQQSIWKKIGTALVYMGSMVNTSGASTYDKFKEGLKAAENPGKKR